MIKFIYYIDAKLIFRVGLNSLNYFATQNGRSRYPNLGFADPCLKAPMTASAAYRRMTDEGLSVKCCKPITAVAAFQRVMLIATVARPRNHCLAQLCVSALLITKHVLYIELELSELEPNEFEIKLNSN